MSADLLEVDGLTKSFALRGPAFAARRRLRAVDGVDLRIAAGTTLGLVGESGCGKSTVGRLILRLLEADGGSVRFDGQDVRALGPGPLRALRRRMQIIFQDPFASLDPRKRVESMLADPIRLHGLRPATQLRERVVELLEAVGLAADHLSRYPHEFSGGQRQRLAIARALSVEPALIVCDEPVSALDVSIQAQIINLLQALQRRFGVAYLFISHDMAVVRHVADRVAVMYAGRIVEEAPTQRLFASPSHPYTRALLAAVPVAVPGARRAAAAIAGEPPDLAAPREGCGFASRCPHAAAACRDGVPPLAAVGDDGHRAACRRIDELPPLGAAMLDDSGLSAVCRARLALLAARRHQPAAS